MKHECAPNLYDCHEHPRWHVTIRRWTGNFAVWAPGLDYSSSFATLFEAMEYARKRAHARAVAAIQDGAR